MAAMCGGFVARPHGGFSSEATLVLVSTDFTARLRDSAASPKAGWPYHVGSPLFVSDFLPVNTVLLGSMGRLHQLKPRTSVGLCQHSVPASSYR